MAGGEELHTISNDQLCEREKGAEGKRKCKRPPEMLPGAKGEQTLRPRMREGSDDNGTGAEGAENTAHKRDGHTRERTELQWDRCPGHKKIEECGAPVNYCVGKEKRKEFNLGGRKGDISDDWQRQVFTLIVSSEDRMQATKLNHWP